MMKPLIKNIALLNFILVALTMNTIMSAQTSSDSLIMKALRDELTRNYQELTLEENQKPFFIAYTLSDVYNLNISASLGALKKSKEKRNKDWLVRLMVGDYAINDENFSAAEAENTVYRQQIEMPLEDDYLGIRRSLWLTTNNVFHSALHSYKKKRALIENDQIKESDLQINDFSEVPIVQKRIYKNFTPVHKDSLETMVRNLSAVFKDYPNIFSSRVNLQIVQATVYFISTEGIEVQFPVQLANLSIAAGSMTEDSDPMNKTLSYLVKDISELPSASKLDTDIRLMTDNMMALRTATRFDDEYFGPVLVVGEVAAETIEKFLFAGSDGLISRRETLQAGTEQSVYYNENSNSLQAKLGKPILSKKLNVTATPSLESYQSIPLIGSYSIDAEGVQPPAELVLIENGVLKTLLNGRTPSREVPNSNGHMRLNYNSGGFMKKVGPGVVHVEARETLPLEELKTQLLEQAKEEGQEYAIMIKTLNTGGSHKPYNFYKVDLETGEEELVHAIKLSNLSLYSFKRSPEFSSEELVHNTFIAGSRSDKYGTGIPASFILPKAVLLKEIEISSVRKPLTSRLPLIDNPVGINEDEMRTIQGAAVDEN